MIPALVSLKNLIKTKSYNIDYPLFRLHYQATVVALLAFCLIITAKILFGDTIDCKSRQHGASDFWDNMCYSQGTFTMYAVDQDDLRAEKDKIFQGPVESLEDDRGWIKTSILNVLGVIDSLLPKDQQDEVDELEHQLKLKKMSKTGLENVTISEDSINYTRVVNAFPLNTLTGTDTGKFLKDNFRLVHRMLKSTQNQNETFSPSVKYIYSGIMVPKAYGDIHTTTYWHRYYQYIPIILFLQAVLFYFPHYMWKIWENGIVSSICKQLHDNRFAPNEFIDGNYHIIDYLYNCFTLNRTLVYKYYLCHVLLFINLILQIIILNAVFNNQFITYGLDVFHYLFIDHDIYGLRGTRHSIYDINNPMDFVFPKVTGCTLQVLSQVGGSPDNLQFLCVLPLNILHDKFFLMLWFWFLILAFLTVLQITFDTIYTTMPFVRSYLFRRRFGTCYSSSLPEVFLLDLIGSNSDKFAFNALLSKLSIKEEWRTGSENESLV